MKNPITYSVSEARKLQRRRRKRNIIILSSLLLSLLLALLIIYVSNSRREVMERTGGTTATLPTTETTPDPAEASEPEETPPPETSPPETTPTSTDESGPTDASTDASSDTNNSDSSGTAASEFTIPDVVIPESNFLPELSHQERDSLFHTLKLDLEALTDTNNSARVSIFYLNLTNNKESFGISDREPFVPAGLMGFPICFDFFTQLEAGQVSLDETVALTGEHLGGGSTVFGLEDIGSSHTLRGYVQNAITKADNASLAVIIGKLGGMDAINGRLKEISRVVDFQESVEYLDYSKTPRQGKHRSSSYDLALFMQAFYQKYLSLPAVYQPLLNDLVHAQTDWGVGSTVSENWISGSKTGENISGYGALGSITIVFAQEPYILCVMTETQGAAAGKELHQQIGQTVSSYIQTCYTPREKP